MSYPDLPPAPPPPEGGGYGGYGGYPQPANRGPRPATVINAVRLMFAQVALSVIGLVVLFTTKDDLKQKILDNNANASDSTVNAAITVGAVIGVIFIVLYALLAVQVGKGKNWARIVTWVLGGIGIISGFASYAQPQTVTNRIIGTVQLAVTIAIVVLLALRESNRYFKAR